MVRLSPNAESNIIRNVYKTILFHKTDCIIIIINKKYNRIQYSTTHQYHFSFLKKKAHSLAIKLSTLINTTANISETEKWRVNESRRKKTAVKYANQFNKSLFRICLIDFHVRSLLLSCISLICYHFVGTLTFCFSLTTITTTTPTVIPISSSI